MGELLTGLTDSRRVNERHYFFDILHDKAIEKLLIAILELGEENIFLNVIGFAAQVSEGAL